METQTLKNDWKKLNREQRGGLFLRTEVLPKRVIYGWSVLKVPTILTKSVLMEKSLFVTAPIVNCERPNANIFSQ